MQGYSKYRTFVTETPIPSFSDLLRLLYNKEQGINMSAFPWCTREQDVYLFSRGAWAIAALVKWLIYLKGGKRLNIFLPDYFCNSTLQPIRSKNVYLNFYSICESLRPNWGAIEQQTKKLGAPDIFILVHFFGFPCGAEIAYKYCENVGAILLEDCAHVLLPTHGMGQKGHAVIYSLHKVIGIPDGGLLVINRELFKNYSRNNNLKSEGFRSLHPLDKELSSTSQRLWLLRKITQYICMILEISWSRQAGARHDSDGVGLIGNNRKISTIGERLLCIFQKNIKLFEKCRRKHFCILNEKVLELGPIIRPLFRELPPDSVPYCYPLLVSREHIDKLFSHLNKRGIPARPWPDLPPEIKSSSRGHEVAIKMRKSLITLPLHHSLSLKQVGRIGEKLEEEVARVISQR